MFFNIIPVMAFEIFTALVAFLAMLYAGTAKFLQKKLVNRDEVEAIQKESKRLSNELKEAQKKGNQKKVEQLMKEQMEFLPKMNKVMMAQFKPMIIILGVFFALTWVVGEVNPATHDDITIILNDDGIECDEHAGDGTYSACHEMEDTNYGKWTVTAKALNKDGGELGVNSTYFIYNSEESFDEFTETPRGEIVVVITDKKEYSKGETIRLYAQNQNADQVEAVLDNGTFFKVDLPVTIPVLNVETIYQPYWWFILISLITNLSISIVMRGKKK